MKVPVGDSFIQNELDDRNYKKHQHRFEQIDIDQSFDVVNEQCWERHPSGGNAEIGNKAEKQMGGFFEVVKSIAGKGEEKSADVARQTGNLRTDPDETAQNEKDRVIQHRRQKTENCIQYKIMKPRETPADDLIKFEWIECHVIPIKIFNHTIK